MCLYSDTCDRKIAGRDLRTVVGHSESESGQIPGFVADVRHDTLLNIISDLSASAIGMDRPVYSIGSAI